MSKFVHWSYSRKLTRTFIVSATPDAARPRFVPSSFKCPGPRRRSVRGVYGWVRQGGSCGRAATDNDMLSLVSGTAFPSGPQLLPSPQDYSIKAACGSTTDLVEYTASLAAGALKGAVPDATVTERTYFQKPVDTEGDDRPDTSNRPGIIDAKPITPLGLMASGDDSFEPWLIDNNSDAEDDSPPATRCGAFAKTQPADKHHPARSLPHACPGACGGRCS